MLERHFRYQVEGNMAAEKSSEAYPIMTLCADCVDSYAVIVKVGPSSEPCECPDCDGDASS